MSADFKPQNDPRPSAATVECCERPLSADDRNELNAYQRPTERRRHPRAAFRGLQRIAPYREGRMPPPSEFRQVACQSISAGGFSFFQKEPLIEREFVVTLTIGGQPKHFKARVVHAEATFTEDGLQFLVGCAFAGRIEAR